jgi:adenine-specific DNA-methyltransferase
MCGAFRVKNLDDFPNLTVKKIPKAVMNRCEWGKDDYSLEIKNLPFKPIEEVDEEAIRQENPSVKAERNKQTLLFNFDGKGNSKRIERSM